jgi:hypothetical protein
MMLVAEPRSTTSNDWQGLLQITGCTSQDWDSCYHIVAKLYTTGGSFPNKGTGIESNHHLQLNTSLATVLAGFSMHSMRPGK